MSEYGTLTVQVRSAHGKGPARRMRQEGRIPAVMYGGGKDNVSLVMDPRELKKATNPKLRFNTLFNVTVQQEGQPDTVESCIIADYDRDAISEKLMHVDFVRVDPEGDIERQIPVVYSGRAVGVALGGKLETFRRSIRVAAPARAVPEQLSVDVTPLDAGKYIRIGDVSVAGGRILDPPGQALAFVSAPKAEKDGDAEGASAGEDDTKAK